MPNYYFNITIKCSLVILSLLVDGCQDIFEKNITKDQVLLIIPANNDTLSSNEVHFKWDEVSGASGYELHIVAPSFNAISSYILDSLVNDEELSIILSPGEYAFKMRAVNSAYQSAFTEPISFLVDSVSDLSGQVIQLVLPTANFYSNQMDIGLFTWQNLFFADYYGFQIWNGSSFGSGSLLYEETSIYGTNYNFYQATGLSLEEGTYFWGIKGRNDVSESDFSTRIIQIDTTAPNNADLIFPTNSYISTSNQITLKWTTNGADFGIVQSPVYSNVQISFGDSLFSTSTLTGVLNISADSLVRQFPISGAYWWRVYLNDEAGNESYFYSLAEKFIIP